MKSFKDFKMSGLFQVGSNSDVHGELILDSAESSLNLFSRDELLVSSPEYVTGVLSDGIKVSLVRCISRGSATNHRGDEAFYSQSLFPHYVIFGDRHIDALKKRIARVSFLIRDASNVFHDLRAFGHISDGRDLMELIAERKARAGLSTPVGELPQVFYFNGKCEVLSTDCALGKLSVDHRMRVETGTTGISVDNNTYVSLCPREPASVEDAVFQVMTLLQFLAIIAGRPQPLERLFFDVLTDGPQPNPLDVYLAMSSVETTHREGGPHRAPSPIDLPIDALRHPLKFANVLEKWIGRHEAWRDARFGFATCFGQANRFSIDRLVGAANMFDVLPASAVPRTVELPPDVEEAARVSKEAFQGLPASAERQSILDALRRLKQVSLRRKIAHRAKIIEDAVPGLFPELELVVREAVSCRNHFVHGAKAKIDYSRQFGPVSFLTDALEFIFATSDLVECGWDMKTWSMQPSALSHPFGRFRHAYGAGLSQLKEAMAEKAARRAARTVDS